MKMKVLLTDFKKTPKKGISLKTDKKHVVKAWRFWGLLFTDLMTCATVFKLTSRLAAVWHNTQLLLFIPPSPSTPYFSIQKLSLASITKGSELLTFSNGRKLKSATSCPGRLKWSPTAVSKWFLAAPLCSVHLTRQALVAPTLPTYWAGLLRHGPAWCEQVIL